MAVEVETVRVTQVVAGSRMAVMLLLHPLLLAVVVYTKVAKQGLPAAVAAAAAQDRLVCQAYPLQSVAMVDLARLHQGFVMKLLPH